MPQARTAELTKTLHEDNHTWGVTAVFDIRPKPVKMMSALFFTFPSAKETDLWLTRMSSST